MPPREGGFGVVVGVVVVVVVVVVGVVVVVVVVEAWRLELTRMSPQNSAWLHYWHYCPTHRTQ